MQLKNKITELIVTFFYIGKIKYAPGTFGSLAAFPLTYILTYYGFKNKIFFFLGDFNLIVAEALNLFSIIFICFCLVFLIGLYFSSIYVKTNINDDPQEIVIDEVAGQMLVLILSFCSTLFVQNSNLALYYSKAELDLVFIFLMPFILFRIFDIFKPWPINWFDANIKGGIGIMLDDIIAALFATVTQYVIVFCIIGLLK